MNSISDRIEYKDLCRLSSIDESFFNSFKSQKAYNSILEHVSFEQGNLYLNYLNSNFPEFVDKLDSFKKNDLYGGAKTYTYPSIGEISPSTLRYIKVLSDLKSIFGNLDGKKIIEIGSGYGGQCFMINQLFNPSDYVLVDLEEALMLNNKYLNKLGINHRILNIKDLENLNEDFDLVISNYAYSEVNKSLQNLYWKKIINKSKNGYFTLNFISHIFNIDSYNREELLDKFSIKNPKILEEIPSTYENNIILYY